MSRPWRLAKACETLRNQLDVLYPKRDRASDGGIGNAEHSSRKSDHNPWIVDGRYGVVSGFDVDRELDPESKFFSRDLAFALIASRDSRIKYIISDAQICSGNGSMKPWVWRPYSGPNAHKHHMHISVRSEKMYYDDVSRWQFGKAATPPTPGLVMRPPPMTKLVLRLGSAGTEVRFLQTSLEIKVDGDFGPQTDKAVRAFQRKHILVANGIVGPATWAAIEGAK